MEKYIVIYFIGEEAKSATFSGYEDGLDADQRAREFANDVPLYCSGGRADTILRSSAKGATVVWHYSCKL